MVLRAKVVYEEGVLKPIQELRGLPEHTIMDVAIEYPPSSSSLGDDKRRVVQIGGILEGHDLGDVDSELKESRARAWRHIEAESSDG